MFFRIKYSIYICTRIKGIPYETTGEMAERSNAVVLKTIDCNRSGGSNPSFSAKGNPQQLLWVFCFLKKPNLFVFILEKKKYKILSKNLGFYACSGFLFGTHEVHPSFSEKINPQRMLWFFFNQIFKLTWFYMLVQY